MTSLSLLGMRSRSAPPGGTTAPLAEVPKVHHRAIFGRNNIAPSVSRGGLEKLLLDIEPRGLHLPKFFRDLPGAISSDGKDLQVRFACPLLQLRDLARGSRQAARDRCQVPLELENPWLPLEPFLSRASRFSAPRRESSLSSSETICSRMDADLREQLQLA